MNHQLKNKITIILASSSFTFTHHRVCLCEKSSSAVCSFFHVLYYSLLPPSKMVRFLYPHSFRNWHYKHYTRKKKKTIIFLTIVSRVLFKNWGNSSSIILSLHIYIFQSLAIFSLLARSKKFSTRWRIQNISCYITIVKPQFKSTVSVCSRWRY